MIKYLLFCLLFFGEDFLTSFDLVVVVVVVVVDVVVVVVIVVTVAVAYIFLLHLLSL